MYSPCLSLWLSTPTKYELSWFKDIGFRGVVCVTPYVHWQPFLQKKRRGAVDSWGADDSKGQTCDAGSRVNGRSI